jgi:hypothetical protein
MRIVRASSEAIAAARSGKSAPSLLPETAVEPENLKVAA